jgi:hypothetical protein
MCIVDVRVDIRNLFSTIAITAWIPKRTYDIGDVVQSPAEFCFFSLLSRSCDIDAGFVKSDFVTDGRF